MSALREQIMIQKKNNIFATLFLATCVTVAFNRKWNRSAHNATASNEYSRRSRLSFGERYDERSSSSSSRWSTQYDPAAFATVTWGEGRGTRGMNSSYRIYFFACAFRARFAAAGRREKERPELKKWNKHANAGHFPSLSLRAECKCADLTALIPATRDARDGKAWAVKGEGENFFSFALPFYCRSLKCYAVTNSE